MKKTEFSLVIPVAPWRNAEILDSLKNLDFPKSNFEVIVEKGTNPSENRNNGIKKAKGEWIVFLDDDAFIDKDYLKKLKEFLNKYPKINMVGGPQLSPKEQTFFEKISGITLTSNFGAFRVNKRYKKGNISFEVDETFLTSANLCINKGVFEKVGVFETSLYPGEDPELISRAKNKGIKIAYNPEMIIYHKRRSNLKTYFKQIFNYGFVRPKKNKINKETKLFFIIPMLFSIYLLFLPTLGAINMIFVIPIILYAFLGVLFSLYDSVMNKSISSFFILPFMYLITHFGYGLGMLVGYLKK
jgi:GT2 family glycosyltransferase